MYTREQKFIRTKSRIFERSKHLKDYRVLKNTLLLFTVVNGKEFVYDAEEIEEQAGKLVDLIRIGDFVELKNELGLMRVVLGVVEGEGEKKLILAGETATVRIEQVRKVYAAKRESIRLMYPLEDER
jgi:hypothetical protein